MPTGTPQETLQTFGKALKARDVDTLVDLYEPTGILIVHPSGKEAAGHAAVRDGLNELLAMNPTITPKKSQLLFAGDIVLSLARWTFTGTEPDGKLVELEGTATDVLRRQADGRWLVAIDNVWGELILD
jgi:ketosteroid isomerase-like protein